MPRRTQREPGPGRGQKVDWAELFDGSKWECVQGIDFTGEAENFRHYVLQRARGADVNVKTRIMRKQGRVSVLVQKTGSRGTDAPEGQLFVVQDASLERAQKLARMVAEQARQAADASDIDSAVARLEGALALAAEALATTGAKRKRLTDATIRGWTEAKNPELDDA
jgi:hypothetical protein